MNLENSNNPLSVCKLRIIAVTMSPDSANNCVYRVYTSDGGFSQYVGFNFVPAFVRKWMQERNAWEYIIPSCMFISGEKVN